MNLVSLLRWVVHFIYKVYKGVCLRTVNKHEHIISEAAIDIAQIIFCCASYITVSAQVKSYAMQTVLYIALYFLLIFICVAAHTQLAPKHPCQDEGGVQPQAN